MTIQTSALLRSARILRRMHLVLLRLERKQLITIEGKSLVKSKIIIKTRLGGQGDPPGIVQEV